MVPRWRPWKQAAGIGELVPLAGARHPELKEAAIAEIESIIRDWRGNKAVGYAVDLVSAASLLPDFHSTVEIREAAETIIASVGEATPLGTMACEIMGRASPSPDAARDGDEDSNHIGTLRSALRIHPLNPFAWVDLAREYAIVGASRSSERAMRTALGLSRNHRFVLRAASRLFLHLRHSKPEISDEALTLLRRAPQTRTDPWLAAAEIAAAMVLGRTPKLVKSARAIISSGNFSPFETSEVCGALASLEIDAGATRRGLKLFEMGLRDPTDNTVAQAAWTARHLKTALIDESHLQRQLSFEANAWHDYRAQRWAECIAQADQWHSDEPFSTRPMDLATFVASVPLCDYELGAKLGRKGLEANPHDPLLRNNLAFSLASGGQVTRAWKELASLRFSDVPSDLRIAFVATWGLIHYRAGHAVEGRQLYKAALAAAVRSGQKEDEALAALFFAREAGFAGEDDAPMLIAKAKRLVEAFGRPYLSATLRTLEARGAFQCGRKGAAGDAPSYPHVSPEGITALLDSNAAR